MKLPELNLNRIPSCLKGSEMELFINKWKSLTATELDDSMKVSNTEVFKLIGQNVPCVGCRRRYLSFHIKTSIIHWHIFISLTHLSVERLFHELVVSGQGALYPVSLNENGILGLDPKVVRAEHKTSNLFILLKYYG